MNYVGTATLGYENFISQNDRSRVSTRPPKVTNQHEPKQSENAALPIANVYASMLDGREFAEHELKLRVLLTNSALWPEGADAPSQSAMNLAREVFHQLKAVELLPTKVVASAEGGVAFCFIHGENYADIECLNSGALLGVTTNRRDRPIVWEIDPNSVGYTQACEKISQFFNPSQAKENGTWRSWFRR